MKNEIVLGYNSLSMCIRDLRADFSVCMRTEGVTVSLVPERKGTMCSQQKKQ